MKELREKKGLDQRELATRVGVTPATISNIETGRSKQVRKSVYAAVLRVLSRKDSAPAASGSDEVLKQLVEGMLELDDEKQRMVLGIVNSLKKPDNSGDH